MEEKRVYHYNNEYEYEQTGRDPHPQHRRLEVEWTPGKMHESGEHIRRRSEEDIFLSFYLSTEYIPLSISVSSRISLG